MDLYVFVRLSICIIMAALLLSAAGQQKTETGDAGRSSKQGPEGPGLSAKPGEPAPHLKTSGVRGSIESGGYSAPAAAKQESILIDSTMRLQVETLEGVLKLRAILPCSVETLLLKRQGDHPEEFHANYNIGQFYLQHAQIEKAAAYLKTARRLSPQDLDTALLLGVAEEGLGNFEAAEEQFRSAAQSAATEQNLFAWGSVLLLLGRTDTAGEVFRMAVAQFPRSTVLMVGLGAAFYEQANVEEARKIWLQAAEVNPAVSAPYVFIANTLNSSAGTNLPEAKEKLSALVKAAPENPQANYAYACLLLGANGQASADLPSGEIENFLQRAIALDPAFPEAHFRLASFYGERGQSTLAIREYQKAIQGDPDLADAHYRLGQLYMRTGDRDKAERELAQHRALRDAYQQNTTNHNIRLLKALATVSRQMKASDSSSCSAGITNP